MGMESPQGLSTQPILTLRLDSATFTRRGKKWIPQRQYMLQNSLLAAVGYLELANATDFAANVWNDVPVPRHALVLMAIGGPIAIIVSLFAFWDARLSWKNICLLRKERYALLAHYDRDSRKEEAIGESIDTATLLDVNQREMGTELIDRVVMDVSLGIGAILVGIGTLMAIGGANRHIWFASNLLSGYIGNSPAAIYGLLNFAWSSYIWMRADRHGLAGGKELDMDTIRTQLRARLFSIKLHAAVTGITGIVAGTASMVTATRWWGYVVLIPCIITSVWCNYYWRRRIAYERPFQAQAERLSKASLLEALETASYTRQVLKNARRSPDTAIPLDTLVVEPTALISVLEFIILNDLFQPFCLHLLRHHSHLSSISKLADTDVTTFTAHQLASADEAQILHVANQWLLDVGPRHFRYREQFLLEALGCFLARTRSPSTETQWLPF